MYKHKQLPVASFVTGIFCALVLCGSARAELVDNPQYVSWAKFKVGTKVTFLNQVTAGPMNIKQTMIQTLKEITPTKVVVEVSGKMEMAGNTTDMPARTQDIAAKVEKGEEMMPPNFKGTIKEVDKATLEVGDKKYECKVYEFSGEQTAVPGARGPAGGAAKGKLWRNEEVPGGVVGMMVDTASSGMQANIASSLMSIEAK